MKVRTKFTLWITLVATFSAVIFSLFVTHEAREGVEEFVDFELDGIAELFFEELGNAEQQWRVPQFQGIQYPVHRLWVRIGDNTGEVIFETELAKQVELPIIDDNTSDSIGVNVPHEYVWIPESEKEEVSELEAEEVKFRFRYVTKVINGKQFSAHIGQPLLWVHSEFHEALSELAVGIFVTMSFIVVIAYMVSGQILKPLSFINAMIREIRESSLDKRIPYGKNKDELYALTVSLNSMFDRLEHSFGMQREFIGSAAHEMKSPLTILILGHEELLAGELLKETRYELEKQLHTMQRLNKLIRDLLSIARLEQQDTLAREKLDISTLIQKILEDYSEIIKEKEIEIVTDLPHLVVRADYEKTLRLFINLIDNGIKYNFDHGGCLSIRVDKQGDYISIECSNTGQMIPAEDLSNIFKQFYRVEKSRSQVYGGSGLGLTIVKRIVRMHGGELTVKSTDAMTTFTVLLPRNIPKL